MVLRDRIAIVTGASSGIGRGVALEFAREGAKVTVADVQENPKRGKYHETDVSTPTVEEIERSGSEGLFVQTDMADEGQIGRMVEKTVETFGGLDILVNNAGIYVPGGVRDLTIKDWDRVVAVNLRGLFIATKRVVPHLKKSGAGRIIHVASVHAFGGGAGPAYAPAKAGVVNLTRDSALELGPDNITVNVICPGYIETALQDYLTEEQIAGALERTPLPRFGTPRDIGRAAVFLASDDAEWITGAALPVDGGWLAPV